LQDGIGARPGSNGRRQRVIAGQCFCGLPGAGGGADQNPDIVGKSRPQEFGSLLRLPDTFVREGTFKIGEAIFGLRMSP